jgi:hypothetical protein
VTQPARDRVFLASSAALVLAVATIGFFKLGPPSRQRRLEADRQRVENLRQIQLQISARSRFGPLGPAAALPSSLADLQSSFPRLKITDPVTSQPYVYRVLDGSRYELCAVFEADSKDQLNQTGFGSNPDFWNHPPGPYCFEWNGNSPARP